MDDIADGVNADKFEDKLRKAIKKQVQDAAAAYANNPAAVEVVTMKPLETFFSFPQFKKYLLEIAGEALDTIKQDERTNFARQRNYFDGEYPQSVVDSIDAQVQRILKGDKQFAGVDKETAAQIETIIRDNINKGVVQIAQLIRERAVDMSVYRSKIIAQTEVVEAVESTREIMYTTDRNFAGGTARWQTSIQDVCPICTGFESIGQIPIDDGFIHPETGQIAIRPPAHPYCRCNKQYFPPDEPIESPVQGLERENVDQIVEDAGNGVQMVQVTIGKKTFDIEKSVADKVGQYKIELKPLRSRKAGLHGSYSPTFNEVQIKASLKGREALHTIYHEIGHGIDWNMGAEDRTIASYFEKNKLYLQKGFVTESVGIATDRYIKNLKQQKITRLIIEGNRSYIPGPSNPDAGFDINTPEGYEAIQKYVRSNPRKHYKYLRSPREVVADGMAQYMLDHEQFVTKYPTFANFYKTVFGLQHGHPQ